MYCTIYSIVYMYCIYKNNNKQKKKEVNIYGTVNGLELGIMGILFIYCIIQL